MYFIDKTPSKTNFLVSVDLTQFLINFNLEKVHAAEAITSRIISKILKVILRFGNEL